MNLCNRPVYVKPTQADRLLDKRFLKWLKEQPSCISQLKPCDPCHYRTAANSGTADKPIFSAVPMTRAEHQEQHRVGQYNFRPREWWEMMTAHYFETFLETL
jgi:hypothetical protein